jgi:hypothetical protein
MYAKKAICLIFSVSYLSTSLAAGVPRKASDSMLSIFENFPGTPYVSATTSALGTVYILKSDVKATPVNFDPTTIHEKLTLVLQANSITTIVPGKRTLQGVNYERVNEPGAQNQNQCVAFAKMMMLSTASSGSWNRGSAMSTLYPNGQGSSQFAAYGSLPYGTVIAHFTGQTIYNSTSNTNPHVAIVQSLDVDTTGKVKGVWVYDQNGMNSVVLNGATTTVGSLTNGGVIMRHYIPWSSTSTQATFSLKNYHIVTD